MSRSRTRASDLWTACRGVRIPRNVDVELLESCRAFTSVTADSSLSIVSHLTAAKLHGLRLPVRYQHMGSVHLTKLLGHGRPQRRHVIGHELDLGDDDIDVISGVAVTSVQRTLLDIAAELSVDELVAVADQIVCAHNLSFGPRTLPMVEIGLLKAYVARHPKMRGIRKLAAAIELVRVGADSTPETQLRLIIGRSPLPEFICNYEILDDTGTPMVAPDLACPEYRTCAEYDGAHHLSAEQQEKDHDRNFITKDLGWNQAVLTKNDMIDGGKIAITKIARMLVLGGWDDKHDLASRSLRGQLHARKDFS